MCKNPKKYSGIKELTMTSSKLGKALRWNLGILASTSKGLGVGYLFVMSKDVLGGTVFKLLSLLTFLNFNFHLFLVISKVLAPTLAILLPTFTFKLIIYLNCI